MNGFLATLKGRTIDILPTTTPVMNKAAPQSSPIAKFAEFIFIASKVEKTSGLPLPKANSVTPAKLSLILKNFDIVSRFGHRKSDAVIPKVVNNIISINANEINLNILAP